MSNAVLVAGFAVALAFAGATSCNEEKGRNCTLAGCQNGLHVESAGLRPNQTIDVCVGDTCVLVQAGGLGFTEIVPASNVVDVKVVVRESGAIVSEERRPVPVTVLRPNGERCPPTCKVISVRVGPTGFR